MEVSQRRGSTVCRTDKHCARGLNDINARGGTSTLIYLSAHSLSPYHALAITYCSLSAYWKHSTTCSLKGPSNRVETLFWEPELITYFCKSSQFLQPLCSRRLFRSQEDTAPGDTAAYTRKRALHTYRMHRNQEWNPRLIDKPALVLPHIPEEKGLKCFSVKRSEFLKINFFNVCQGAYADTRRNNVHERSVRRFLHLWFSRSL